MKRQRFFDGHISNLYFNMLSIDDEQHYEWYDIQWYDMTFNDMIWYSMIWYDIQWYDMIFNDTIFNDIQWCDAIFNDMYDIKLIHSFIWHKEKSY